jgi:serine protease Do
MEVLKMRFWKAGGTALVLGSAAFIMPADTAIQAQTRRAIATPAPRIVEVLSQGVGSRIGVSIDDVSADDVKSKKLASQAGALIQDVDDGTPASKAGLKAGDVVIEFDGERVRSARQLTRLIQETPAGRQVAVVVSRDGQRMNFTVEPESRDSFTTLAPTMRIDAMPRPPRAPRPPQVWSMPREALRVPPTPRIDMEIPRLEAFRDSFVYSFGGGRLGVATQSLSGQLAKHFGVERGVLVSEVTEDSAASKAGIRAGDIITKVNDASIDDTGDLVRELARRDGEVTIEIVRGGKTQTVKATIEAARARTIRREI